MHIEIALSNKLIILPNYYNSWTNWNKVLPKSLDVGWD